VPPLLPALTICLEIASASSLRSRDVSAPM